MVEKPFTPTLVDAQALFQLASERGLLLEGYQKRRFDSDLLTAQTVLASGKLGTLQEAEFCWERVHGAGEYVRITSYAKQKGFFDYGCMC